MNNDIEYIVEDAARIVIDNISLELKLKLSFEDIIKVLDTEFDYQQQIGLTDDSVELCGYPHPVNEDAMQEYIISECAKVSIHLTQNDIEEILEAEAIYLEKIGLIDDEGMQSFHN